jgi:hypothetical protein
MIASHGRAFLERRVRIAAAVVVGVSATFVEAGGFAPPGGRRGPSEPFKELGAFCRVATSTRWPSGSEMHHCLGLDYPSTDKMDFDLPGALRQCKKTNQAPAQIVVLITRKDEPRRRRLVCAYPNVSKYRGSGDVNAPANFTRRTP